MGQPRNNGTTVKQWGRRPAVVGHGWGQPWNNGTAVQQWFELVELVEFFAAEGVDPGGFVVDLVGLAQRLADPHAMVA